MSLLCALFVFISNEEIIYPEQSKTAYRYTDNTNGGNSRFASYNENKADISFDIDFDNGFDYPYAGIGFEVIRRVLPMLDSLSLKVAVSGAESVSVLLLYESRTDANQKVRYETVLPAGDLEINEQIVIPVKKFAVPTWWFSEKNLSGKNIHSPPSYELPAEIEILFRGNPDTHASGTIEFISFSRSIKISFMLISLLLLFFLLGIMIMNLPWFIKRARRLRTRNVVLYFKELGIESEESFWNDKVYPAIEKNSGKQNINKRAICNELSISEREMNRLIKKYAGTGFSKLTAVIRIKHACLLLKQVDTSVLEIAGLSGFGSLSYFNKLFKEITGSTPVEYRKGINAD